MITPEFIIVNDEKAYRLNSNNNYYITKSGVLYSVYIKGAHGKIDINNPHEVAYGFDKDGYKRVVLSINGQKRYVKIHTLVVEQFIGTIPSDMVINHIDGNRLNNNVNNLEIITSKENTQHAWKLGLSSKEHNPLCVKVNVKNKLDNSTQLYTSLKMPKKVQD